MSAQAVGTPTPVADREGWRRLGAREILFGERGAECGAVYTSRSDDLVLGPLHSAYVWPAELAAVHLGDHSDLADAQRAVEAVISALDDARRPR